MKNIYDNGSILLGTKKDILDYWKNNPADIYGDDEQEIKEYLKDYDNNTIVAF